MKPEVRPISISIVSLLGVVIPGTVWTALLVAFLSHVELLDTAAAYVASLGLTLQVQPWGSLLAGYFIVSFLIGAGMRPHVMRLAEWLSRPGALLSARRQRRLVKDFHFPYKYQHEQTKIYSLVCERVESILGSPPDGLSRYEPFNSSKRILRVVSPRLWEELEYAEAESRMAGSLFLASLAALLLSLLTPSRWTVATLMLAIVLGRGFRRYREREVKYGYLNFAVGTSPQLQDYTLRASGER